MHSFENLLEKFNSALANYKFPEAPLTLYNPVDYILSIGGKRARPLLTLASYNLFADNVEFALDAAICVEVFHNFTLLHDDIMDASDLRRGRPTVHKKYNQNSAILSGDVMLIWSYKLLNKYLKVNSDVITQFTQTAIEVCEGQRFDMDFETRNDVTIEEYINMIALKTSVLLGEAMRMGGAIANCSDEDQNHLYGFGKNIGIAFQIQDDLLDTFGNSETFGKRIGGDILNKKKTYLYLKSLELLSEKESNRLREMFSNEFKIQEEENFIAEVKGLYKTAHVDVHTQELKLVYQQLGLSHLNAVSVDNNKTEHLRAFAEKLLNRNI